jgi:hypothetical protein
MQRRVSFAALELPLQFHVAGAQALPATARELTYVRNDDAVAEAQLELELSPEAYRRVDREQLFHLGSRERGPGADDFAPGEVVRLTVGLAADRLPDLLADAPEPSDAGRLLEQQSLAGGGSSLLSAESWFALSVTSPVELPADDPVAQGGELASGYATTWATPRIGRLQLPMLEIAAEVLDEHGWDYEELDDDTALGWRMSGPDGTWSAFALAREGEGRFAVYSVLDDAIPGQLRADAAELVARANWGLPVGNWELDMDDGTVRCKTSIDIGDDRLSLGLARRVIARNLAVVDAYIAAFSAFAAQRVTAREAIAMAEG